MASSNTSLANIVDQSECAGGRRMVAVIDIDAHLIDDKIVIKEFDYASTVNSNIIPDTVKSSPVSKISGSCLFRLYYPTLRKKNDRTHACPVHWFHPFYAEGFVEYLKLAPTWLFLAIMKWYGKSSFIKDMVCYRIRRSKGRFWPLIPEVGENGTPPRVVVVSHGLAGMRTIYSNFIYHLISQQYNCLVIALEHRDGSACATIDELGNVLKYKPEPSDKPVAEQFKYRLQQLELRNKEINLSISCLKALMNGTAEFDGHLQSEECTSPLRDQAFLDTLKTFDWDKIHLAGHSFGGATCILKALNDASNPGSVDHIIKTMFIMDPWMEPIATETDRFPLIIKAFPELKARFINSDSFHWKRNLDLMTQLQTELKQALVSNEFVPGTKHVDFSDFTSFFPTFIVKWVGLSGKINGGSKLVEISAKAASELIK